MKKLEVGRASPTYFDFASKPETPDCKEPVPPTPLPDLLNNRYRLDRLIGIGGMSTVYCAHDARRAQFGDASPYVAIKVLNDFFAQYPDANALLYSEFALTQALHHPNVIRLYDFDVDSSSQRAFISMEWLEGIPLDQLISDHPQGLSWEKLQPIALDLLEAVAHIHARDVVHGDLKPSNLILNEEGLRLFDFGLAESTNARLQTLPRLQRERIAAWTPCYASLELLENGVISQASDVYAIACVLYELATGQHPYQRCDAQQARDQRLDLSLAAPLNLPEQFWEVVRTALKIETAISFITTQEILDAFKTKEHDRRPRWLQQWRTVMR